MDYLETQATLDTGHRTKRNKKFKHETENKKDDQYEPHRKYNICFHELHLETKVDTRIMYFIHTVYAETLSSVCLFRQLNQSLLHKLIP
jgi:hypothetical protein